MKPPKLAVSKREAARLLGIDRGATLAALVRAGRLRLVPWGKTTRIPLTDVHRLVETGFTISGAPPRARRERGRARVGDPAAVRAIDIDSL